MTRSAGSHNDDDKSTTHSTKSPDESKYVHVPYVSAFAYNVGDNTEESLSYTKYHIQQLLQYFDCVL